MSFTVVTEHFTYEPAAPGLGGSPTYLVTPRNGEGWCLELFHTSMGVPAKDERGFLIVGGAWKVTEYDRNDEAVDIYWFKDFAEADGFAYRLWEATA